MLNIGANKNIFINNNFNNKSHAQLNIKIYKLLNKIPILSFNNQLAKFITQFIIANININSHLQIQLLILMINIGKYNLILRKHFFKNNNILINCKRKHFVWPQELLYII